MADAPSTLSESELIAQCRCGDLDAFDTLVERHQTRVYNLCLWQLRDPDEAADAAQNVFIRAWRSIDKFRGESSFSTWLHRIAVNVTHDAARKRSTTPTPFSTLFSAGDDESDTERTESLTPDLPSAQPDAIVMRTERQQAVRAALATLPDHYRLVLVLFDMEGHSYEDVSVMLELPMGTVKSRLNRARAALRQTLDSYRELFEDEPSRKE
jgi:RNA polymerase sigma-70 factor (ECF subfamily)